MAQINNLDEAILNINKSTENIYGNSATNKIIYSNWSKGHSSTLGKFYGDFIVPRLPDPQVVLKWNDMLVKYTKMPGAVFPIRGGYSSDEDKSKLKLRRGWLVRIVDGDFSYTFTDNYLPAYIYKMALDGFCPTPDEFYKFMTEFVREDEIEWLKEMNRDSKKEKHIKNAIDSTTNKERYFLRFPVSFGRVGSSIYPGNTETVKNAYINTSPAPKCPLGDFGYKHAHVLGVRDTYKINGTVKRWNDIGLVELGEESYVHQDYKWDDSINNFVWYRKMKDEVERGELRKIVVAHFLRFLNPINHFLTPKRGCNEYTKDNNEISHDVAEYRNLLTYMLFVRENSKDIGKAFKDFEKAALYPENVMAVDNSSEIIDIKYYQNSKVKAPLNAPGTIVTTRRGKTTLSEFEAFEKFAKSNGVNNPSGYSSHIRKIMEELNIKTLSELRECVDRAIECCTQKMNDSVNEKEKKTYSNRRCALKKYKEYLETGELYIHYKMGWSSFRSMDEHLSEYIIEGNMITIFHNVGFTPGRTDTKKISPKDMEELLSILDDAITMDAFETSNTLTPTVHDSIETYNYSYLSEVGNDCGGLFTDDSLKIRYHNLIDKFTK